MGKSKDKKASREAKADKKLALGVKRKQLKRKKDRGLDGAVESERADEHSIVEDKELARSKKIGLTKQKKKSKHAKVKGGRTKSDDVVECLTENKDEEITPELKKKKKNKKKLLEGMDSVKVQQNMSDNNESETPKIKKKNKKSKKLKEGKGSVEFTNSDEIVHGNQDEETVISEEAKKSGKNEKKDKHVSSKKITMERHVETDTASIDEIPSVDEDPSRGMKKWMLEYRQKRPGLKVLQQRIDEFITAHEEKQEQERKEREARAAEDGWTVVVHHKGRKKTTDAETGTAVGSVSLAAMQDKMAKKKTNEIDSNFYRFQKREAHINELAMLQSKFEQDKKRIQQLRAQRKFKPY